MWLKLLQIQSVRGLCKFKTTDGFKTLDVPEDVRKLKNYGKLSLYVQTNAKKYLKNASRQNRKIKNTNKIVRVPDDSRRIFLSLSSEPRASATRGNSLRAGFVRIHTSHKK